MLVCGVFGMTVAAIVLLAGPAGAWMEDAPRHLRSLEYKLWSIKGPMEKVSDAGDAVEKLTTMGGGAEPIYVEIGNRGIIARILNTTGNAAVGIFLTLVLLYFMLAGGERLMPKLGAVAPDWKDKHNIVRTMADVQNCMSSYLLVTTCINMGLGIAIATAMWLLGLPNPILWGVMAACLNFIPFFGCLIGAAVVCLVALISNDSLVYGVGAAGLYIGINGLEGYFITPSILSRSISLSPLAILISLMLWGWIWGVGGMLIAVPLLAAAKITCDHIKPLHFVGKLVGR